VERAYLVAVSPKRGGNLWSVESSLTELEQLANSAGAQVAGRLIQRLPTPSRSHYLGMGKLKELVSLKDEAGVQLVIFDDELSPQQQINLEKALEIKVIDRVALILDIFVRRAQTREGQLQVQLAQLEYLLPRLAGQWSHLERLGGGIGTRGPGESQLETDRRLVQRKIHSVKAKIEQIRKQRELYRQKRRRAGMAVVALVGYTNAGKSTLLNRLGRADVITENRLFSTLDPTTRRLHLPNNQTVLVTDTVGFIQKLSPKITAAFRATLEELAEARILINVVDITSHNAAEQCHTVENILGELGISDKPRITVLNKIDLLLDRNQERNETRALDYLSATHEPKMENTQLISAGKGWGMHKLEENIAYMLGKNASLPAGCVSGDCKAL